MTGTQKTISTEDVEMRGNAGNGIHFHAPYNTTYYRGVEMEMEGVEMEMEKGAKHEA